ncbi:MAG: hypothetical protein HYX39_12535 [Bacteroidetes bacterium]|nr:hypothetical protein [Bacteroidota bacterium]
MKKHLFCLSLALSGIDLFAQTDNKVPDNLFKQIQDAKFCGEIVVTSFDSVKTGSTWARNKLYCTRLDLNSYQSFAIETNQKGRWPKEGDTCLVIVDKKCMNFQCPVSSFAKIKDDRYYFWSPYSTNDILYEMKQDDFWRFYKKNNWQYAATR